jgi:hypothetical protein
MIAFRSNRDHYGARTGATIMPAAELTDHDRLAEFLDHSS